jgi:hypothetical protein
VTHGAELYLRAPIYGYGFGIVSIFENAYLEFFVQGWMIALLAYFMILINILIVSFSFFKLDKREYLFSEL